MKPLAASAQPASQYALNHKLNASLLIIGMIAARLACSTDALLLSSEPLLSKYPGWDEDASALLSDGLKRSSGLMVTAALVSSLDRMPILLAGLDGDQVDQLLCLLNAAQNDRESP